jgi:hypothetical protein
MGYTHYWRSNTDIPPDPWQAISDDVRKLAKGFNSYSPDEVAILSALFPILI